MHIPPEDIHPTVEYAFLMIYLPSESKSHPIFNMDMPFFNPIPALWRLAAPLRQPLPHEDVHSSE